MNAVICSWNRFQIEISQTVQFQLKSQRGLKMTVNRIFHKLINKSKMETKVHIKDKYG